MTPDEATRRELALAILLWRSLRANFPGVNFNAVVVVNDNLEVTAEAERMADAAGCRREFYELMVQLPVLDIKVRNLDADGKRGPRGTRKGRAKYS